jgi:hypothetical protein
MEDPRMAENLSRLLARSVALKHVVEHLLAAWADAQPRPQDALEDLRAELLGFAERVAGLPSVSPEADGMKAMLTAEFEVLVEGARAKGRPPAGGAGRSTGSAPQHRRG